MKADGDGSEVKMGSAEASKFRRGAAKLNYLGQDRVDIAFASKEISNKMSCPLVGDEALIKRIVRYLVKFPRLVVEYPGQKDAEEILVYTDSEWGGCVRTRRSTSGGTLMRGKHLIVHWSRTHQLIALSSTKAELNAAVKAAQEGLGLAPRGRAWTVDASAIAGRLFSEAWNDSAPRHGEGEALDRDAIVVTTTSGIGKLLTREGAYSCELFGYLHAFLVATRWRQSPCRFGLQKTGSDVRLVGRFAGERLGAVTPEGGSEGVT